MKDKAYRLGQAYAIGYQMAQDDWVTLENKEGEQYRVNLPGDNPGKKDESKPKYELKANHVATSKEYEITKKRATMGSKRFYFKTDGGEEKSISASAVTTSPDGSKIVGYDPTRTSKGYFTGEAVKTAKTEQPKEEPPKASGLSAGKESLLNKGKEWTGGNNRRTYLDQKDLADLIGLKVERYKGGGIKSAEYDGDRLSNNKAFKMLSSLDGTYFDHNTGKLVTNSEKVREAFESL